MAGLAEDPWRDTMRASDAEREVVLTELGEGFAQGRLSHETFVYRVEATLRARHQDELDDQLADLPGRRPGPTLLARVRRRCAAAWAAVDDWVRPGPPVLLLPAAPGPRYTIGREWSCDMSIADMTVSRWHADLHWAAGAWRLADLGSLNGTRLNGWRISEPAPVHPGDLVTFGTVTYVLGEASPAAR
jgi:hypothetical protein